MLKIFTISACITIFSENALGIKTRLRKNYRRSINSHDFIEGEYSFVVILAYINVDDLRRICTGSLIAENWVMSTAHCVKDLPKFNKFRRRFYVWYGNFTVSPKITKYYSKVLEWFVHPSFSHNPSENFDYFFMDHDISLLRVSKMPIKNYGRLSAVDHMTLIGLSVMYVGSGWTNTPGDDVLRPLQIGEGVIVKCANKLSRRATNAMCITTSFSNALDSPKLSDSGGPLMHDGKIIGMDSFIANMFGCTPISPYVDWINNVIHAKPRPVTRGKKIKRRSTFAIKFKEGVLNMMN